MQRSCFSSFASLLLSLAAELHLRFDRVGHRFGPRILFRRAEFEVAGGESVAITGSNGSGKSTLVQIAAGVLSPARGSVVLRVDGQEVSRERRPRYVGLLAPYCAVYEGFTARENLEFIARVRGLIDSEERIGAVLRQVGLGGREDDRVGTFSSGLVQRVKLAAAIVHRPALLVMDEPSVTLDEVGRELVREVLEEQTEAGGIVLLATNDAREAGWCDRRFSVEEEAFSGSSPA